ncbi:MAG: GGDEF domain-containing protein [Fuerstiella sp.]
MQPQNLSLADSNHPQCIVQADTCLRDIAERVDATGVKYVLVQSNEGTLLGVVESEQLKKHLRIQNAVERKRWEQMPIESALTWKLTGPSLDSPLDSAQAMTHERIQLDCTAIKTESGTTAILSESDVFVSWNVMQSSLSEAMTDPVTGLSNRLVFERRLSEEMCRAARDSHSIAVILFDVDRFKEVNDQYGHSMGDRVLADIAAKLKQQLRSYDVLARYGGDEFAAICCGCGWNDIDIPVGRVLREVAEQQDLIQALPAMTLSIGAAVVHNVTEHDRPAWLIHQADMCLYRSKQNGRNQAYRVEQQHVDNQPREPVEIPPRQLTITSGFTKRSHATADSSS